MGVLLAVAVVGGTVATNLIGVTIAVARRDGWQGFKHFWTS